MLKSYNSLLLTTFLSCISCSNDRENIYKAIYKSISDKYLNKSSLYLEDIKKNNHDTINIAISIDTIGAETSIIQKDKKFIVGCIQLSSTFSQVIENNGDGYSAKSFFKDISKLPINQSKMCELESHQSYISISNSYLVKNDTIKLEIWEYSKWVTATGYEVTLVQKKDGRFEVVNSEWRYLMQN